MIVNHKMLIDFDHPTENKVLVKQGDNWSRTLEFVFVANGKQTKLTDDDVVSVRAITPKGATIFRNIDAITENGTAFFTLTENMLLEVGRATAQVTWTKASTGETINSFDFYIISEGLLFNENETVSDDDLQGVKDYMIQASQAAQKAEAEASEAEGFAAAASDSADTAKEWADKAEETIKGTAELVEQAKEEADRAATEADRARDEADAGATLSESWAIGGTGTREGEDLNNSMFYANRSQTFASNAERSERYVDEQVQQINNKLGATNFDVNLGDGHLYYDNDAAYTFTVIKENGHLDWRVS